MNLFFALFFELIYIDKKNMSIIKEKNHDIGGTSESLLATTRVIIFTIEIKEKYKIIQLYHCLIRYEN